MPVLQIRLLGGFAVTCDGYAATSLDHSRLRELLAYLALHRDPPVSRQFLAFLLWPDSSEAQARTNLRNLLYQLLHKFSPLQQYLELGRTSVHWRAGAVVALDVSQFEAGVNRVGNGSDLQEAIDLYRGEFLPGLYAEWVLDERERLQQLYASGLRTHINCLIRDRDYLSALSYTQRLLRIDPLREETYRELMRISALSGDAAGVVRFFNLCKTVLERELGVEPSDETRRAQSRYLDEAKNGWAGASPAPPQAKNLPLQINPLIGREAALRSVTRLMVDHRLVTLTGFGGVGKTRLALAAAHALSREFRDGAWLFDLAALPGPEHVMAGLASLFAIPNLGIERLTDTLTAILRERNLLIVLDNCEHWLQAAGDLAELLLQQAPYVRILATSREPLAVSGEWIWTVPPLAVPAGEWTRAETDAVNAEFLTSLLECPSVSLYVSRVQSILPTFNLTPANVGPVVEICRRLEGIPLALELAAGRANVMSSEEISARLDNAMELLGGGSVRRSAHHRALRATLDWSYQTLTSREQQLLRCLAVFAGGFTADAAAYIAADCACNSDGRQDQILDLLSNLTNKSLVIMTANGKASRGNLLELVRQYAYEKLVEVRGAFEAHARHLTYFSLMAARLDTKTWEADQIVALGQLELERNNFRTALAWSTESNPGLGLELASSLSGLADWHGYTTDERTWIETLLALNENVPPQLHARALFALANSAFLQADLDKAAAAYRSSLELYRQLDNGAAVVAILARLGVIACAIPDFSHARDWLDESIALAERLGQPQQALFSRLYLGYTLCHLDALTDGHALLLQGLEQSRTWGTDGFTAVALLLLGIVAWRQGNYRGARMHYLEMLTVAIEAEIVPGMMYGVAGMTAVAAAEARFTRAARLIGAVEKLSRETGIVFVPYVQAQHDQAIRLVRDALSVPDYERLVHIGRSMTLPAVAQYALGEED